MGLLDAPGTDLALDLPGLGTLLLGWLGAALVLTVLLSAVLCGARAGTHRATRRGLDEVGLPALGPRLVDLPVPVVGPVAETAAQIPGQGRDAADADVPAALRTGGTA